MRGRAITIATAALLVSGCAQMTAVTTPARAISLADRACYDSWGKDVEKSTGTWDIDPKRWHARLEGDHWLVWNGDDPDIDAMSIDVPRDGTPPDPGTCRVFIQN